MRKELSHVMLELHNVRIKPSNVRKKVRKPPNVRKELSHMMLELHNVRIEPSSVKKIKGTTQCDKRIVIYDVGTVKCEKKSNRTTKCDKKNYHMWCWNCTMWGWNRQIWEKKVRKPLNVRKELLYVILEPHNVRIEPLSVRKR